MKEAREFAALQFMVVLQAESFQVSRPLSNPTAQMKCCIVALKDRKVSTPSYCVGGRWECSKIPGCGSTCSVGGFGHYQTLDHTHFDFYGECEFVLLSNCDHGDPLDPNIGQSFRILTQRSGGKFCDGDGRKLELLSQFFLQISERAFILQVKSRLKLRLSFSMF